MTVTATRAGIKTQEAWNLPGGKQPVLALPELPHGAHAPICLDQLFTRELHSAATSKQTIKQYSPRKKGRIDIRQ